jgi:serine/threonine-protein kinase
VPEITQQLKVALADRYLIERELGQGGMATVYLAHDVKHERKVALKVLRPELAAVIGAERFLAEIKVTANLQHPHILPLHDSGEAESFLYYVMPYVEGETLRDKIQHEKQLAVDEAVEITRSVAAALDYAHRHEVVHRGSPWL